jgi:hypothetical protein
LSIISRWLEDTFNEAATGIAKQVAPLFGVDKTKIDQEMPKPLDAFTQKVGPGATKVAEKVLGVPGIAPILKGALVVYEEAYRRPLTTATLLTGQDKLSDIKIFINERSKNTLSSVIQQVVKFNKRKFL